jgi:mono/diheme cytochrome c family protein
MGLFDFLTPDPSQKKVYDVEYKKMKEEGYPFHPFATWKDMVMALIVLLTLLALTFIKGVHLDAPADPTSQYLPRPEWYFMFLFQLLKYFPGPWAVVPVAIIPGVAVGVLVLLPFIDKNPYRHPARRPVATALGVVTVIGLVGLTGLAYWDDYREHGGKKAAPAHAVAPATSVGGHGGATSAGTGSADGSAVFAANCVMCHGTTGAQMPPVKLFDKAFMEGKDVVATVTNGKGAMPAFKGRLSDDEIKAVADYVKSQVK